ncbi:Hypothetical protein NTJ_12859 [Nesidiocoris tenuis]|uniref:Cystatin domain-containing protein n=1 Tax=Nesidiocoris tenuis TaxID=355587 RepID=A0ABN7BB40_9HEMI|nr:Hypothetical protein NTJ_12859 [Nesidiocoris tenuis]
MQVALFATALIVASVYGAPPSTPGAKEIVEGVAKKCVAQTKASPEQAKLAFSQAIPKNDVERVRQKFQ